MHDETVAMEETSLRDYLDLLSRRKWIIIQTFVVILVLGVVIAFLSPRWYRSEVQLFFNQQNANLVTHKTGDSTDDLLNGSSAVRYIDTQAKVLSIQPLLDGALTANGLPKHDPRVIMMPPDSDDKVDIITLAVEARQPNVAQNIAQKWAELYIERDKNQPKEDLREPIAAAETELKKAQEEWTRAASDVQKFQNKTLVLDYAKQLEVMTKGVAAIKEREDQAEALLTGLQAQIAKGRQNLKKLPAMIPTKQYVTNPGIADLQKQQAALEIQMQGAREQFKPDHPRIKQLDAQIQAVQRQLREIPQTVPLLATATNPEVEKAKTDLLGLEAAEKNAIASLASARSQRESAQAELKRFGSKQFDQASLLQTQELARKKNGVPGGQTRRPETAPEHPDFAYLGADSSDV